MEKILIVEDDNKIARLEQDYLESNGYETEILEDGGEVISRLRTRHYDLVLLDIMLPNCNGYDICRQIRDEIDVPILMVTARTEGVDIIRGLGLGADDYITKPFDPSQLVARVRSHLKRYARLTGKQGTGAGGERGTREIQVQDVRIEPETWRVWKKDKELKLPNREFVLLCFLAENPNLVFSKEALFEKIWGYDYISDAATVSVHINRLREKIEDEPRNPKIIETVWGAGYRTGASWLCYFRALQLGNINKVVPIDKSSTVLTILLALIFLGEGISIAKMLAVAVIGTGIFLMIGKKENSSQGKESGSGSWFLYAWGSAVFASLWERWESRKWNPIWELLSAPL